MPSYLPGVAGSKAPTKVGGAGSAPAPQPSPQPSSGSTWGRSGSGAPSGEGSNGSTWGRSGPGGRPGTPSTLLPVGWGGSNGSGWRRSGLDRAGQPKPFRNPSNEEATALAAAGWVVPERPQAESVPEEWFAPNSGTKLSNYSYDISDEDWDAMKGLSLRNDYKAPANDQGPARVSSSGAETVELTKAAYDALSDAQRNAVDFNTLLIQARETDLKKDFEPLNESQTEGYNETVRGIFGDTAGSSTVAPRTVELLETLGINGKGSDLDQFLSLERAVDTTELKTFSKPNAVELGQLDQFVVQAAGEYVAKAMRENPFGDTILQKLRGGAKGVVPIGWGDPATRTNKLEAQEEQFFQNVYGGLTDPTVTIDDLNANLASAKFTQDDMNKLWSYLDDYTRYEQRTGLDSEVEGRRSAADIRKLLGLED